MTAQAKHPVSVLALETALAFSWQLLQHVEALALQFSDDIELPPNSVSVEDSATLQTAATLYLAAELEAARLLPTVEFLAGLAISGGLRGDLGRGAERLLRFRQRRDQRFSDVERTAFFARLFGTPTTTQLPITNASNVAFEPLMIELTDALYNFPADIQERGRGADIALRLTMRRLAENLLPRSGGLANFAAQDMIRWSNEALDILKDPNIQRTVGANSVWETLREVASRYVGENVDVVAHVQRGRAGVIILAWLAARYPLLDDYTKPIADESVIAAAAEWLQSSLSLEEAEL